MKRFAQIWLFCFLLAAVLAHFKQAVFEVHHLPQTLHFGRDAFGRDCIPLLLSAAFESICAIIPVAGFCLFLSFLISLLISFSNPKGAFVIKVMLDTLSSLPGFLFALALGVFFPDSEATLVLAAFFMIFPWLTRFFESHLTVLKLKEYVDASRALGASKLAIFITHLLPELLKLLVVIAPFLVTRLLLLETSLSFLGLGQVSEHETWGRLIYQGRDYLTEAPWILVIFSFPLCITLFSLHLISRDDRL